LGPLKLKSIQRASGIRIAQPVHLVNLAYQLLQQMQVISKRFEIKHKNLLPRRTISTVPRNHWKDKSNQLKLLKEVESKLGITTPTDWYKITNKNVIASGGVALLNRYESSIKKALKALYPEVNWDPKR
jgi:hypothetical protein